MMMMMILLLATILTLVTATPLRLEDKWTEFKLAHGKFYDTPEEESHRFEVFRNNLKKIEDHNAKYKHGHTEWYMGVNHFADMTSDEFLAFLKRSELSTTYGNATQVYKPSSLRDSPERLDLRPFLNRVRDQGGCGSCYAFAVISAVEASYLKKYGKRITLSPQNIVDCAADYNNFGCIGGVPSGAMEYIKVKGIMSENDYPYKGRDGNCTFDASKSVLKLKGYTEISNTKDSLISALNEKGTIVVTVDAREWQFYEGGIFYPTRKYSGPTHAVVLAGYGKMRYTYSEYWIVRNSWGDLWGEDGNIRLNRNMTKPYHVGIAVDEWNMPPVHPEI